MAFLPQRILMMVRYASMMCLLIILCECLRVENLSLTGLFNFGANHLLHISLPYCFTNGPRFQKIAKGVPVQEHLCSSPRFFAPNVNSSTTPELFEVHLDNPEVLLRYSSALVQGATNVFWIDIQTNTRRFQSLFRYLLEDVALDHTRLNKIPFQAQRDTYLMLSRFILFYNKADKIDGFLKQCPAFPTAFLVGGPADILVTELTDQLQKLKVEPVLLHYLSEIKILQGMELRMTTSTRLKTCLYSFTSPGGPMYPTRAVRHAARESLDLLFPVGRYPRHLISLFFRLLYPWYWPSSCWNFVVSCIQAIFYSVLGFIFSTRNKIAKPKSQ
ncbi:uncharacterized protein LOC114380372 isoform X2 [Glycine soja]|uniref:uncharacterized protein LOC114380372 isoform X2 n=1 Tax=Glycine soja TaxID=3848 RepID=UPI001039B822|nr:uncharacterized protein LOC114380372 isoform X2 [Glycine soja]